MSFSVIFQVALVVLGAEFVTDANMINLGYEPMFMSPANLVVALFFFEMDKVYAGPDASKGGVSKVQLSIFATFAAVLLLDSYVLNEVYSSASDTMQTIFFFGSFAILVMSFRFHVFQVKNALEAGVKFGRA